jgi:ankyrin repeat protein
VKSISFVGYAILLALTLNHIGCNKGKSSIVQEEDAVAIEKEPQPEAEKNEPKIADDIEKQLRQEIPDLDLRIAIRDGDVARVTELLEAGIEINFSDPFLGETPLIHAVTLNHKNVIDIVVLLIDYGVDIEAVDITGRTALSHASQHGKDDIVELLLARGADPNNADEDGVTPLMVSSISGHRSTVELLLDHGAKAEAIDTKFYTTLDWALAAGNKGIYTLLSERMVRAVVERDIIEMLRKTSEKERLAVDLRIAIWEGKATRVAELLKGVGPIEFNRISITTLCDAARYGNIEIVRFLLDFGADVDAIDYFGQTPLVAACWNGYDNIVRLLLAN